MAFGRVTAARNVRDTQFELIGYLLDHKAYPQAQAELITTASSLPRDLDLQVRVASCSRRLRTTSMRWLNFRKRWRPPMTTSQPSSAPARQPFNWAATELLKAICRLRFVPTRKIRRLAAAEDRIAGLAGRPFRAAYL